jgi:hypothetical protein
LTWEHIYVSIKNLGTEKSLRILLVTIDDKIIAIAPLRTARYKLSYLRYNVIEPLDYENATDYTGFIIAEQKLECLRMFLNYLSRQNDWAYFNINDVPETSTLINLITMNNNFLPKFLTHTLQPETHHRKELGRCLDVLKETAK